MTIIRSRITNMACQPGTRMKATTLVSAIMDLFAKTD